ncbi:hypothetical protein FA592_14205 [Sulfurospirillum diekertiae]|uniref:Uncharacterized protein n=1 Tax=Sulfurospirillum diekertiae TaxID=1854492 RepID=A0A1Y0HQH1_9BACT|nr:hypothetical protein [Sulfurospirillum diekertiae]ARU49575.1 hypothetical protein Sdiek1_2425 [Sulfurospirillum diekertiae]ASC94377.1 hypothetical protein Sdiek2_2371 [Sulfurospirillum diekertiae]ATB70437.1 hypothetical protein SJPD1_2341 [Sulfurospirillum diekertiae]QNA70462.1 hypothetical protein FA584_14115 [Sulfurospirillum diekertiae]QNT10507.1 hypothetical protein FA592_14205 [Sulfurospirillum diekertiae]
MKLTPYSQNAFTPIPSKFTLFRRTCVIWQVIKFIMINIRMTILIIKSHH